MNYPNGIVKKEIKHLNNYANRGMSLEDDINNSNQYYRDINKAFIYKKPTPIKIVDVDYKSRKEVVIKRAYFSEPSTTDYNGVYKGKYIDFEAKETKSKTSFSLRNIHKHQIKHLSNVLSQGGIAFLIVRFSVLDKTYLLPASDFIEYININNRKSVPLSFFNDKGYIITNTINPRVDYLKIIDKLMED